MSVVIENQNSGEGDDCDTTLDVTLTIVNAKRLVAITSVGYNEGFEDPTVTWDFGDTAQAMTRRVMVDAIDDSRLAIFDLHNPTVGENLVCRYILGFGSVRNLHVVGLIGAKNEAPVTASSAGDLTDTIGGTAGGISIGAFTHRFNEAPTETQGNDVLEATAGSHACADNTGLGSAYVYGSGTKTFGWSGTSQYAIAMATWKPFPGLGQVIIAASRMRQFYRELKMGLKTHDELAELYGELMVI